MKSRSPAPRHSRLSFILAVLFLPFAVFILSAAVLMPMSFDDAFNATLPLNLARGNGYASSYGSIFPFNPYVSSGALFLAPAALPIALFGNDMQWPMLYTAALSLTLLLLLLRSLHTHEPTAAWATAILAPFTLWQGKNDPTVVGNIVPVPPYGFWYQLLGNLPGVLALALAISLLLEPVSMTIRRGVAIVLLIVFAVNAKQMHFIPLACMLVAWAALPVDAASTTRPRLRRLTIAIVLLAVGCCGVFFNRALAWLFLDNPTFHLFAASEAHLLREKGGPAKLLSFVQTTSPFHIVTSIVWNALHAVPFLGVLQAPLLAVGLVATAVLAWRRLKVSSLARLALVLFAGVAGHFAWWASVPYSPTRHLTAVAGLTCCALGCGFGLAAADWRQKANNANRRTRLFWRLAFLSICAAAAPELFTTFSGWRELRQHRNEQTAAAAALERLGAEYPSASFCGAGWWVPRELTYLAPRGVALCNLDEVAPNAPGSRILMLSTNLWTLRRKNVSDATERCTTPLQRIGRFEFRGCDGFDAGRLRPPS